MNTVLKFPLERVQRRSFGMHDSSHNAEVFVFEGVQYEKNKSRDTSQTKKKTQASKVISKL